MSLRTRLLEAAFLEAFGVRRMGRLQRVMFRIMFPKEARR